MFLILTIWQICSIYLTHRISDEWATGQETCAYVGFFIVDGVCRFAIVAAQNLLALLVVWHKHGQRTIPFLPSLRQVQETADLEEQAWTNRGL